MTTMLASALLVDHRGWVLLQERDEKAPRGADQWGMPGGHVEDCESFEEAATDYIAEVRQVQAHGPYLLGGFSGQAHGIARCRGLHPRTVVPQ